jgi:hypothetical protein
MPGTKSQPCLTPGCRHFFKPRRRGPKAKTCILCRRQARNNREREAARVRMAAKRAEKRARLKGTEPQNPAGDSE